MIYIKYVPPTPEVPVQPSIHPRERPKQKIKKIRMKKERYRKNTKKKAIKFLNKKNATKLLKEHNKQQKPDDKTEIKPVLGVEDRLKRKRKAIEKLKNKNSTKQIKKTVIVITDYSDNFSDAETIPYAEPYRDTT